MHLHSRRVFFRLSPGNSHDAPEGRKLIESIYSKNNNYLLMDRAYENDKTLALAKAYGLKTIVPPKKNRKFSCSYDKHIYKQRKNIERYFLRLKRFRKVFICYDKFDSIFISTISLHLPCFYFWLAFYVNDTWIYIYDNSPNGKNKIMTIKIQ